MADTTLGKLLAKSKSIRRNRKGSVGANSSFSAGSDDTASVSRGVSSLSRFTHHSRSRSQSRSTAQPEAHEAYNSQGAAWLDSDDAHAITIQVPAGIKEDEDSTSLVSYDSEDADFSLSTRPSAISNHPSQIGYLTTNSPLIQADYYQGSRPSDDTATTDHLGELDPSGSPNLAGLAPPSSRSSRRSPSPVGRIRGAFRSKKSLQKLSGGSDTSSLEGRPATANASTLPTDFGDGLEIAVPELPKRHSSTTELDSDAKGAVEAAKEQKQKLKERTTRLPGAQSIEAATPPGTPPAASDKGTPVIVNTPPTPTHASSPRSDIIRRGNGQSDGGMISQRRGRSDSASIVPSKLSTISSTPLTPIESVVPTPTGNNPTSGFFTSMFSAAQSAAQNLSNTISNTNISPSNSKSKGSVTSQAPQHKSSEEDKVEVESSVEATSSSLMESQEPAVKTIGMGDLSLSQLGLAEPITRSATPTMSKFPDHLDNATRSRSESAPADASPVKTTAEVPWGDASQRPQSLYEPPAFGDKTPPTGSIYEEGSGIYRSGSVRSAIGRRNNHSRKRGSTNGTGGTGNTIGAALSAVNSSLAQTNTQPGVPKLTGFAVASKRRNRDFHALFKSVPDDDYLIEDYSCALQREILAHGRLYVSEGHLCFSSNILGWVTTLVMSFDEIVSVEKRSTALLFKNGLMISTLHAKHIFASFASRDSTYDLIVKIWKLGHPGLQSSLNGVRLDETGGDKTEKIDAESVVGGSQSPSASEDEEELGEEASDDGDDVYDEDEEEDNVHEALQPTDMPLLESAIEKSVSRKPSGAVGNSNASPEKPKDAPVASKSQDFPGPTTHAPTDCGDAETHYKRIVGDDVVPAPLGKIYDMLFGPGSVAWMTKFITSDQKCTDLQMEDKKGLSQDNRTRTYSYIKPLSGSIGPRQTKCIISETVDNLDLEKAVNIQVTTQTPDVPSGNVFSVKTKYCLTWAENNSTRVQINCTVEWTGKSWLKGPIENGANDGQSQFCKDIFVALKAAVSKRSPAAGGVGGGGGGKSRKRGKKGKSAQAANVTSDTEETSKTSSKQDWGMLEPLRAILGPVVDIGKPLLTGNVVYGLLVGLLVAAWFGFGFTNKPVSTPYGSGLGLYGYPDRLAAYEEMWRREESELWEWLEERVGMDRLNSGESYPRKKVVEPRTMEEKLREDRMDEREIKEAIRITEEKLNVLKSVVDKKDL